jgi:hypothetical protein
MRDAGHAAQPARCPAFESFSHRSAMVTIEVDGDSLDIQVQGGHKLWALKSSLRVPLSDVVSVRHDPERASTAMPGLRMPGTHVPFLYTAGTYYQSDFRPDFWTVRRPEHAVVIQCRDSAAYDEIIVEVEDPAATVALISGALERGR